MTPNPRLRVLCVDDDEDAREMLVALLSMANIEAITVKAAVPALALIEAESFDLDVLDAWLPEIDGFELCRRMRAFDPKTPVLFFSGAAYDADRKRAIDAGAVAYVIKPNVEGLLRSITQLVSKEANSEAGLMNVAMTRGDAVTQNLSVTGPSESSSYTPRLVKPRVSPPRLREALTMTLS